MPLPKRKRQPRRICAFCGGGNVSDEHFWPQWAEPLLPNGRELSYVEYSNHLHADDTERKPSRHMRRQGSVINKTVRAACERCNSGWMSRLEMAVQPILTPLALGEVGALSVADQLTLARWVCLKTMVAEANLRGEQVTFRRDRHQFRRKLEIPSGFSVWVLYCGDREWRAKHLRFATNLHPAHTRGGNRPNLQMSTFGFASALFVTVTSRVPRFRFNLPFVPGGAFRFWPAIDRPVPWPPRIRVTAPGADYIAATLQRFKGVPLLLDPNKPLNRPDDPSESVIRGIR